MTDKSTTTKTEVSMFEKAWKAMSHPEQIHFMIYSGFFLFALFFVWLVSIAAAASSVDVPVVLKSEVFAQVYGQGDDLYALAVVKEPLEDGSKLISSQELTYLGYNLRAQVTGQCSAQSPEAEELYGYGIEVTISYLRSQVETTDGVTEAKKTIAELGKICADPNTSIVAGRLEQSSFDGVTINGFEESAWYEVTVPPYYVLESKEIPFEEK